MKKAKIRSEKMRGQLFGAPNQGIGPGPIVRLAKDQFDVIAQTAEKIHKIEAYTDILANGWDVHDFGALKRLLDDGIAEYECPIGTQLPCVWNNGSTEYEFPWDIVDYRDVVNARGNTVRAAILQAHWCLPGVQFDGNEAFKVAVGGAITAGKKYITMGNAWGSNVVKDKIYSFTLTEDVPEGGQLVFGTASSTTGGLPDQSPSNWRVWVYASSSATSPTEKLELTEEESAPEEAEDLGTLSSSAKYDATGAALNNMQRASYGYNRWSQSGVRQYLNSAAAASGWWTKQNPYDRPPDQLTTTRGFMAGLPQDLLDVVEPIVVTTALNTVSDVDIGTTETTLDTFFLPSLEEEYAVPQLEDVEGPYWPYWKERLGLSSPQVWYGDGTNANHIRYLVSNHASAQSVRLRSADRGSALNTWNVLASGTVSYGSAAYASALAPACAICASD